MRALPLMLTLMLMACGDKDTADTSQTPDGQTDTGPDTDTPTAPDHETDCTDGLDEDGDGAADCADSDCVCLETDCADGNDDDLDGLLDCEDDDCVDICVEVCDDGADNDSDGAVDCGDDECYGVAGCGGAYSLTLTHTDIELVWAWDAPFGEGYHYSYPFATFFQSTIQVTAIPEGSWGGEAFRCTGVIQARMGIEGYAIGGKYIGTADEPGYLAALLPSTADESLSWDTETTGKRCPITELPVARLGFWLYQDAVYRYSDSGEPYSQYRPGYVEEYPVKVGSSSFMVRSLKEIRVGRAPSWSGLYD